MFKTNLILSCLNNHKTGLIIAFIFNFFCFTGFTGETSLSNSIHPRVHKKQSQENSNQLSSQPINNHLRVVVIDAGHGGEDPGALGKNHKEKDITLSIALKLGEDIEKKYPDVKVIYTRNTDVFIPLHERAEIANRNNADLFISIHANANKKTEVYGMETYAMGLHTNEKNFEVAKKENAAIIFEKDYSQHYEGYDPNSPESFIIFSLMQNTFLSQSLQLAGYVQEKSKNIANRQDRGVRQAGFLVLWKTTMPSILIEVGYITNPEEEKYLASEDGQSQIAKSICAAFGEYKEKFEKSAINYTSINKLDTNTISPQSNYTNLEIKSTDSVIYKVQIFSLPKPLSSNSKEIKNCKEKLKVNKVDEIYWNNYYKYAVGETSDYDEIVKFAKEVKQYYPEAFIIAIKNGEIVPLSSVIKK
jgi:N-acetylmuramoyl-L-alanine amidase